MKKLTIVALAAFFSLAISGSALALENCNAAWAEVEVKCQIGTTSKDFMKGSKNVYMHYKPDTTNSGTVYSLGSYHSQGNKIFASSSGDQKIFWTKLDLNSITAPPAIPDNQGGPADWSGAANWSAM